MSKPICKVKGMIQPGAMCGYVIVGMKHCGFSGDCEHKACGEMIVEHVEEFLTPACGAEIEPGSGK